MKQKNLAAIGAVSLLLLVGAGCKSEANVDISAPSATPPAETNTAPADQLPATTESSESQLNVDVNADTSAAVTPPVQVEVKANADVKATTKPAPAVKEFTVSGSNFAFSPSVMNVKKGDKVRIVFKNADGFHDLKIDELNVATKKIKAGEQDVVEFMADKVGLFEYYCSVGSHRANGMKGTLTVSE